MQARRSRAGPVSARLRRLVEPGNRFRLARRPGVPWGGVRGPGRPVGRAGASGPQGGVQAAPWAGSAGADVAGGLAYRGGRAGELNAVIVEIAQSGRRAHGAGRAGRPWPARIRLRTGRHVRTEAFLSGRAMVHFCARCARCAHIRPPVPCIFRVAQRPLGAKNAQIGACNTVPHNSHPAAPIGPCAQNSMLPSGRRRNRKPSPASWVAWVRSVAGGVKRCRTAWRPSRG